MHKSIHSVSHISQLGNFWKSSLTIPRSLHTLLPGKFAFQHSSLSLQTLQRNGSYQGSNDFQSQIHTFRPNAYWPIHCKLAGGARAEDRLKETFRFFFSHDDDPTSSFALWQNMVE